MKVGIQNAERYLGDMAFVGDDLAQICAGINRAFGKQHLPDGQHRPLPVCVAYSTASQTHGSSGSYINVEFGANALDTHNLHNISSSNHVFTIAEAGIYLCLASVNFASGAVGSRALYWADTETAAALGPYARVAAATQQQSLTAWAIARLAVNARITVRAFQDSGSSMQIGDAGAVASSNWAAVIRVPWAV